MRQVGATLHRGARASHCRGLSCCGAQAPDVQAQQLWLTGPVTSRHVGSSQTRARTRVPCIGRQTLNHCATREAQTFLLLEKYIIHSFMQDYLLTYYLRVFNLRSQFLFYSHFHSFILQQILLGFLLFNKNCAGTGHLMMGKINTVIAILFVKYTSIKLGEKDQHVHFSHGIYGQNSSTGSL